MTQQTEITQQFPRELLDKPIEIRKQYFKDKIVAHASITDAHTSLMSMLRNPIDGQIIIVIGAPGVGKTTVCKAMERDLLVAFLKQPKRKRNPAHMPVAGIELEAFQDGLFKWKKTRQVVLKSLYEPMVDKKIKYRPHLTNRKGKLEINTRLSSDDLGEILVEVLAQRQPRALWFDEGQHLIKVRGARGLLDQLDVIKSLANRSNVTPVLFGTYEMTSLLGLSPQLDRRTRRIHIPRYRASNPADVREFQKVLLAFQKNLPFPVEPNLLEYWVLFFEGSLGCIGILKDWLYQAAGDALDQEEDTLAVERCEAWLQDRHVLLDMTNRIMQGEQHFEKLCSQIQLRTLLGLPIDDTDLEEGENSKAEKTARSLKPGQRKPVRDQVDFHE